MVKNILKSSFIAEINSMENQIFASDFLDAFNSFFTAVGEIVDDNDFISFSQ